VAVTDTIELRGLRVLGVCGVLPEERERPQPLELDIDIACDLSVAGTSDDLDDTVDYGSAVARVEKLVGAKQPRLLEKLAEMIALDLCTHATVHSVTVAVRKLRPPVPQDLATCGVRITRPGPASR
jgi:dihydroneopterin aldolase